MSTIEKAAERMAALRKKQAGEKSGISHASGDNQGAADGQSTIERLAAESSRAPRAGAEAAASPALNQSIYRQEAGQETSRDPSPSDTTTSTTTNTTTNTSGTFQVASQSAALRTFNFPAVPDEVWEIDLEGLEEMGYLSSATGKSRQSNEFRRLKRPLLLRMQKDNALAQRNRKEGQPIRAHNRVMVTSALPGEGKTYASLNLAVSLSAEMDGSVTLIDGDVAKGDITRLLNLRERTGLGDVLLDSSMASRALVSTSINRLSVLPAGTYSEHLGEMYASDMMDRLLNALDARSPNQILLFDAPPLLVTTEASVLAQYMDQVVLVVEANRTPREAVQRAIEELDGCENISLLLNKTTQSSIFGYGYGYGYGYGARDDGGAGGDMDAEAEMAESEYLAEAQQDR